jgi:hypothetical protein
MKGELISTTIRDKLVKNPYYFSQAINKPPGLKFSEYKLQYKDEFSVPRVVLGWTIPEPLRTKLKTG